jgi:queuine tRNA-ribosyltransferase
MSLTYPNFSFEILKTCKRSKARLGKLSTPHGDVMTPAFIFCATKAAIKGASPHQMKASGTQFILSNTYHLMLSPGSELIARFGGLHKFMGWNGPMLTDSGGFQVFSLGYGSVASEIKGKHFSNRPKTVLKISEEGVTFKSYLDGARHTLTPEKSMQVQRELGADFVVVFDECTPYHVDKSYTEKSLHLSHRWGLRCLKEFSKQHEGKQALYGILQGGVYEDLRREAVSFVNDQPFFGHAIGGSLGAEKQQMYDVVAYTMENLDGTRPVHLLGIGGIADIFEGIQSGIDTFDCVHPTRLARHGGALIRAAQNEDTRKEHINLRNQRYKHDEKPIDDTCPCETCNTYARAYLHYLLRANEMLAMQAITVHNVTYMNRLLEAIRNAINDDRLQEERKQWIHD